MARSRLGILLAAAASLALLGASFANIASTERLRLSLPNEREISEKTNGRIESLEDEIEGIRAGIDEEIARYGTVDQKGFLAIIESILGVFAGNAISMNRLDIQERDGTKSLEIHGEGTIMNILKSLAAFRDLEYLLILENLTISEGRDAHDVSLTIQPASVPDLQDAEKRDAVYSHDRPVTGTPDDWARRLFGYRRPASVPRTVLPEPPMPDWLVFIGRFRTEGTSTEYAFRDDRDGRIRLLSSGEMRQGWSLVEEGGGSVVLEIEGRRYEIEVPR